MKRFLTALSALAILSFTAGCSREVGDVSGEGDFVQATFNVSLPDGMATKAISDGSQATELLFQVYDANGNHMADMDQTITVTDKQATVNPRLIRGMEYKFVFWAQKPGMYTLSDGKVAIADASLLSMMNEDAYDAFWGAWSGNATETPQDVQLTRPFAQINLAVDADDLATATSNKLDLTSLTSSFAIDAVNNQFDVSDGTVRTINANQEVTVPMEAVYDPAPMPGDDITFGNETYTRLAMLYVLAEEDSRNLYMAVTLETTQNGNIPVSITKEIANVPIKRNYRTNIVGKVFTVGGSFNVTVEPGFATPDNETEVDPQKYYVSFYPTEHGNIAFKPNEPGNQNPFAPGATVILTAKNDPDYHLDELYYYPYDAPNDHIAIPTDGIYAYTFKMPAKNVTVVVTFKPDSPYTGSGTAADPYTVADVRYYIDHDLQDGVPVYVKGKVSGNLTSQYGTNTKGYGTFFMVDNPGDSDNVEVYKADFLGGISWATGHPVLKEGDEVVIFGEPSLYNSTYEMKEGFLYSLNGIRSCATTPTIRGIDPDGEPEPLMKIPADMDYLIVSIEAGLGDTIYYTTDGTDPTPNSMEYTGTFAIFDACTVKAIATKPGLYDSAIASQTFTKAATYTVKLNKKGGGILKFNTQTDIDELTEYQFTEDNTVSMQVIPMEEYGLADISYLAEGSNMPVAIPLIWSNIYEFDMPASNVTVTATFYLVTTMGAHALAAASARGAVNNMNDVISFTNSSFIANEDLGLRIKKGKVLTISASGQYHIKKIELTGVTLSYWGSGAPSGYTFDNHANIGTWIGSESSVSFTAVDNDVIILNMSVFYEK